MPVPKSVIKIKKDGVEYVSNVDRINYTMEELSRAALRDSAKLIRKRMVEKLKKLPGMKRHKRIYSSTQYWVRRRETDLQIGFKHDSWYGARSELGTKNQPARGILRSTVFENVDEIRIIQGKYLSAVEDENKALSLIDPDGNEYTGKEDGEDD
jgi:HK97 gp10 family phage protein